MESLIFYVYLWLRHDGLPYYVGKGRDRRAYISHRSQSIYRPVDSDRIIVQYYETESNALKAEMFFIALYGRKDTNTGILCNRTDGGESNSGRIVSDEQRKHIGASHIGNKYCLGIPKSEEHRKKLSIANTGYKHSEESRKKMSEFRKGNKYRLGILHSEEMRKRISESMKRVRAEKFWSTAKASEAI